MKVREKRKKVRCAGYVELDGRMMKVWCHGKVTQLEHEVEMTNEALSLKVDDFLRGPWIPKEFRPFALDAIIRVNGKVFGFEHDRGTESMQFIAAKLRKLRQFNFDVLWTVPTQQRREMLLTVTPAAHWIAISADVVADPHGPIWINSLNETAALESADWLDGPLAVIGVPRGGN